MLKVHAIQLLGGSTAAAADTLGMTYQGVRKWPDKLPDKVVGHIVVALLRRGRRVPKEFLASIKPETV